MTLAAAAAIAGMPAVAQDKADMLKEVTIQPEGLAAPLAGTMAGPTGSGVAGIVIVPGSGPTDRDGNNRLGITAQTYRLLATALAEEGIPTIRSDKRGMFASTAAIPDANEVTIADYARDTLAWAAKMRAETGADCAWLLGHSEGGVIALAAAGQDPAGLCGVILVATPGRRLGDLLKEQLAANGAAPLMDEISRHIATLESGGRIEGEIDPRLAPLFGPQLQTIMASLLSQDPAAQVAALDLPVLILQGGEDLQVTAVDAQALSTAQPDAKLVVLDGVNHVLKAVPPGDRAANLAAYADAEAPLADGVVPAITAFIAANPPDQ